jgi:hypothetical protein
MVRDLKEDSTLWLAELAQNAKRRESRESMSLALYKATLLT